MNLNIFLNKKYGEKGFGKGVLLAISLEAPELAEDILKIIADIPLLIKTLPQYLYYRIKNGYEFDIKKQELGKMHPIIGLMNIITDKETNENVIDILKLFRNKENRTAGGLVSSISSILTIPFAGLGIIRGSMQLNYKLSKFSANIKYKTSKNFKRFKNSSNENLIDNYEEEDLKSEQEYGQENLNDKIEIKKNIEKLHPLLSIMKIKENSVLIGFSFKNIKYLNDNLGQNFVDIFMDIIKEHIYQKIEMKFQKNYITIKNDYKNLVINIKSNNCENKILQLFYDSREQIINQVIKSDKLLNILPEGEKIKIKKVLRKIDIGIGYTNIASLNKDTEKVHAIRQAELASKNSNKYPIKYTNYDIIEKNMRKFDYFQQEIFLLEGEEFELDGQTFPVISQKIDGEKVINPALIRAKRKGKEIKSKNFYLNWYIEQYLLGLNNGFDFIFPGGENINKSLQDANRDNEILDSYLKGKEINEEEIKRIEFLQTHSHKGMLSKDKFMQNIESQNGISIFVDIKDMGIMNFSDFKNTIKDYKINKDEDILLSTGSLVTSQFNYFIKSLSDKIGDNIELSAGGDELYIFIRGTKFVFSTIKKVDKSLKESGMKGRLSLSYQEVDDSYELYNSLELNTLIIKSVEENLDIYFNKVSKGIVGLNQKLEENFIKAYKFGYLNNISFYMKSNNINYMEYIDFINQKISENIENIIIGLFTSDVFNKVYELDIDGFSIIFQKRNFGLHITFK
ncbi:hypothetical protein [Candidatus Vampirococcus lugosii]|uniref:GGDEF domain-containing protein n=1 Tax=Candidatus Vampirococcus lugosii TaxID=2789015 RepID=A0ABS5QJY5_9BACT|nr:hypothetical protein [Candidatus Vampirococcus lugosii]MBS8121576.1 hypothetical protein [Candidatus Vampirococcus lugosii]